MYSFRRQIALIFLSLVAPAMAQLPDPGDLQGFRDRVGETLEFTVTGSLGGTLYGTGVYTDDSPLATAAVHSGFLQNGETGDLRVTILAGTDNYVGSTQNGITSISWSQLWLGSYQIEGLALPKFRVIQEITTQECQIVLEGAIYPGTFISVFGPDTEAACQAWVAANCLDQFRVIQEITTQECQIVPEDAIYPGTFTSVFGPDSEAACEAWVAANCGGSDRFANAVPLIGESTTGRGDNTHSSLETNEWVPRNAQNQSFSFGSLWWKWEAPFTGKALFGPGPASGGPIPNVYAAVMTANSVSDYTIIASNEATGSLDFGLHFQATQGQVYHFVTHKISALSTASFLVHVGRAPSNDDFANSTIVSNPDPMTSLDGDHRYASLEPGETDAGANHDASVWWLWSPLEETWATIVPLEMGFFSQLILYSQVPGGDPVLEQQVNGSLTIGPDGMFTAGYEPAVRFLAEVGKVYHVALYVGPYQVAYWAPRPSSLALSVAPTNDHFMEATDLGNSSLVSATGTNYGSSIETGEPLDTPNTHDLSAHTVWWTWTAPSDGLAVVDTFGSDFDTFLEIYTGSDVSSLTEHRWSDDALLPEKTSRSGLFIDPSTTYHIRVRGYDRSDLGDIMLNIRTIETPTTAADHLLYGRAYLEDRTETSLASAENHFSMALALDPNNEEAKFFAPISRFLIEEQKPEYLALLQAAGFESLDSNPYVVRYRATRDANGSRIAPENAKVGDLVAFAESDALPALRALDADLAKITDKMFFVRISDSESPQDEYVEVDFGDIQAMRASAHSAEAKLHLVQSLNMEASIPNLMDSVDQDGKIDFQKVLLDHPDLLKVNDLNRRQDFKVSVQNMNSYYQAASSCVRVERPDLHYRGYFTLDHMNGAEDEDQLRTLLNDLCATLDGSVSVINGEEISLGPLLGMQSVRDILPTLRRGRVVTGSAPNTTFDGLMPNGTHAAINDFLTKHNIDYQGGSFANWSQSLLRNEPVEDQAGSANVDGDPLDHFTEYAFDLDPYAINTAADYMSGGPLPRQPEDTEDYFAIQFKRRLDDPQLSYTVYVSDNLTSWDTTEVQLEQVGEPVPSNDGLTETVTYRIPAIHRKFLQIMVSDENL